MQEITLGQAIEQINTMVAKLKSVTQAGLLEAALKILGKATSNLRASVITGNLKASGYVRNAQTTIQPDASALRPEASQPIATDTLPELGAEIGFTANYAIYAHEYMGGRAPKYLERPIMDNLDTVVKIIEKRAEML